MSGPQSDNELRAIELNEDTQRETNYLTSKARLAAIRQAEADLKATKQGADT